MTFSRCFKAKTCQFQSLVGPALLPPHSFGDVFRAASGSAAASYGLDFTQWQPGSSQLPFSSSLSLTAANLLFGAHPQQQPAGGVAGSVGVAGSGGSGPPPPQRGSRSTPGRVLSVPNLLHRTQHDALKRANSGSTASVDPAWKLKLSALKDEVGFFVCECVSVNIPQQQVNWNGELFKTVPNC